MAKKVFLSVAFLLLFSSFFTNIWQIANPVHRNSFDIFSDSFILGKLSRSQSDGIFYKSGFSGFNFNKADFSKITIEQCDTIDVARNEVVIPLMNKQKDYYLNNSVLPDGYCLYLSQIGGSGFFYSFLNIILPFNNHINYQVFRLINCLLIALCFIVFLAWLYRNFGFVVSFVTFILLFFSPWLVLYSGNALWWSLWNFYLPFLTVLLLLEKRHSGSSKISNLKIYVFLFISVFIKCFFTGFEFITVPLLSIFCPVVYYYWLENKKIIEFIIFSFKLGLVALVAILVYMGLYVFQLYNLWGDLDLTIKYILGSYTRRTSVVDQHLHGVDESKNIIVYLLRYIYLKGNAFDLKFINFEFYYSYLFTFIGFCSMVVLYFSKKIKDQKYAALILTAIFSFIASVSWIVFFKNHALIHPHMDFIIWYMSFLLYGFALIGVAISLIIEKIRTK